MLPISPQLIVFSYHKSGTSLFLHVMTKVAERLGLTLANHYGAVDRLDTAPDVVLLPHSILRDPLMRPYRAVRLIRDPRDIWVSGYLYHMHCDEGWCRNTDTDPTPPIGWPKVDYSVAHWPEDWKRRYLERLGSRSYQRNLVERSLADGLDFELAGYTGCTLATMREWTRSGADVLDVKLEDVMADFDGAMGRIFDHFRFTADQSQAALEVARTEDIRRMDDAAIAERPQIYSRRISKWRDLLSRTQIARFDAAHGDLVRALGYELASTRPVLAGSRGAGAGLADACPPLVPAPATFSHRQTVTATTQDAAIRLSADGTIIRPSADSDGTYVFVVPPGRRRVQLVSRFAVPVDSLMRDVNNPPRLGVKVSRIAIRSDAGELVIAADDPSLTMGWHAAEQAGSGLWRWTDGSAELPWDGVFGPAIVTIDCGTLRSYPIYDETCQRAASRVVGARLEMTMAHE